MLESVISTKLANRLRTQECEDVAGGELTSVATRMRHTIAKAVTSATPVWFCIRCGAWTTRRLYNLSKVAEGSVKERDSKRCA